MHLHQIFVAASFALSLTAFPGVLTNTAPTLAGPIYVNAANTKSQEFLDASSESLAAILEGIKTGLTEYGPIDNETTSFSVAVFSATTNETLFEYHFEAPQLNGSLSKSKLTDETIYRSGSMGKLLVMFAFLVDIGDSVFLDPVTKYIPELKAAQEHLPRDPIRYVNWEEVTVGSLATQLSGIGRDWALGDYAKSSLQAPPLAAFEADGYPWETPETITVNCTSYGGDYPTCTRKQYFAGLVQHPPAFKSYTQPMYSNLNFALLGMVYEAIRGETLEKGWDKLYHKKLNMPSTTLTHPGPNADTIIPYNDTWAIFSYSLGLEDPAGGQYTSIKDLKTWALAILKSTELPEVLTRRWFTHAASTAVWTSNVGTPFEIYRLPIVVDSDYNLSRIVNIYSKSGDVGQYSTSFALIPDYDLAWGVLSAGVTPNTQASAVRDIIASNFINAAEAAAKAQAKITFPGYFKASDRNSSITLTVDNGPGVLITSWISNGTDWAKDYLLFPLTNERIYPTGLERKDGAYTYRAYRMLLSLGRIPDSVGLFSEANDNWLSVDSADYNNQPLDEFIVQFDRNGVVQSLYSPILMVNLTRSQI